ncbi:MAG: hypothetical protein ACK5NT_01570 [Pyrinomonadaceae bacterium]
MPYLPLGTTSDLVVQDLNNETIVINVSTNKACCLNKTAGEVFYLCNGKRAVEDIAADLSLKHNSVVDESFVWLALDQLNKNNLLENKEDFETHIPTISRRKLIKTFGVSASIALPLITALIAPKPVAAQSCIAKGGSAPVSSGAPQAPVNAAGLFRLRLSLFMSTR